MQSSKAYTLELAGLACGVRVEHGCFLHKPLLQPHALTVLKIDGRIQNHDRFPEINKWLMKLWRNKSMGKGYLPAVSNLVLSNAGPGGESNQYTQQSLAMRCYLITCELHKTKRRNALTDHIRRFSSEWKHPHDGLWLVKTSLTAREIRSAILPHVDFNDRIFICEAGHDHAEFNGLSSGGGRVTQLDLESVPRKSRILEGIFNHG